MAELAKHFKINSNTAKSKPSATFKGDNYRITILSELLIRLEYSPTGAFLDKPTEFAVFRDFEVPAMGVNQDDRYLMITTKYFKMEYAKNKPFKGSALAKDSNLKIKLLETDKTWYYGHPEARNFLGTNSNITEFITRNNLTKGLYSTDGFASIDDSDSLVIEDDGYLRKRNDDEIDIYLFMYKKDFGPCLKDYFKLTGKPALIRRSALGIWWNKDEEYDFNGLKRLIAKFNKNQIPISNIVLGNYWSKKDKGNSNNKRTGYTIDDNLFPSPTELTTYLHDRGIALGLNIDPSEGILPSELAYKSIQKEVKLEENQIINLNIFDKYVINTLLNKLLKPLNNFGVDFFFIDYLNKNYEQMRALNYYIFNNYSIDDKKRGMIMAYNGLKASHRYPIYYSGQTTVSWKTLNNLPYYNSRAGNIGLSWWSHDIGGYKDGIEEPELYARYVELGTFSPIFRLASNKGKYYKREPWLWDVKTLSIVKEYCTLRQRLIPYLYTEGYKYYKTGLPIVQPLYYKYPEIVDEPTYRNQYFFGTELFIAPITTKKDEIMNRVVQKLFIPNGTWYEFKSGKKFPGGKRYITFYKDEDYPVFAKSGSIIPLGVLEANKNVTSSPKEMEIHIFPGMSNTYNLYEDDGESRLYEEGFYIVSSIDYNYLPNNYTVIIRPLEGKSGIIPPKRDYTIRFRNTKEAEDVIVYLGDSKWECTKETEDVDFIVKVKDVPTTKQLTINCKGKDIEIDSIRLVNDEIDLILSDLQIETALKEKIAEIIFSNEEVRKKRIQIRKLKNSGLEKIFIRMFLKLLEYIAEI